KTRLVNAHLEAPPALLNQLSGVPSNQKGMDAAAKSAQSTEYTMTKSISQAKNLSLHLASTSSVLPGELLAELSELMYENLHFLGYNPCVQSFELSGLNFSYFPASNSLI